jgi:hypothetical protein
VNRGIDDRVRLNALAPRLRRVNLIERSEINAEKRKRSPPREPRGRSGTRSSSSPVSSVDEASRCRSTDVPPPPGQVLPIWLPRAMAGPPGLDVAAIRAYCEQRVPSHAREEVCVQAELDGNAVTIVERRPPWRPGLGTEWTSSPIARLRYVARDKLWSLYWRDRNSKWHRYTDVRPTPDVSVLLDEVDEDPTGIFWG